MSASNANQGFLRQAQDGRRLSPNGCIGVVLTLLTTAAAHAAGPEITSDAPAEPPGVQRPLWELGLGVAGLRLPDYRGSDQYHAYALPLPYVVYRGKWLRADREGARALLLDANRVKVDVSVAASVPTRSRDNAAREGMPDLAATGEIGPNVNVTLFRATDRSMKLDLRLPVRAAVTFESSPRFIGATFSPNLNLDLINVAGGWNVGLLAGPLYGNRKYHAHFYGVDEQYATATRPAYQAPGGYAGWQALAATSRRFGNTWVGAFVRYDSLAGAVFADSPLVRSTHAVTAGVGISWVFARSSELVTTYED
ncbi:MAG TPA: MipA/OmpV family protein [Burkholderiaceae bacterium]|nr:MipA/OmpV family protein [Burkholderiaceae bacterium]